MKPVSVIAAHFVVALCLRGQSYNFAELARTATELQRSGDYSGAADAYRKLVSLNRDDVVARVNLGVCLVQLGRFDEAIAEYEVADKLLPNDPRIALNVALAYQKSGRLTEAQQHFEALHAATPNDPKVTMLLADCLLQTGDDSRVIELLKPLASISDDMAVSYMLGMALLRTGKTAEGQTYLDRILHNGDSAEARFLLGTRMFESGDYPAAVKQLALAVELNPKLPLLQSLYGRALLMTGDPDGASEAFGKELATNPNDFGANLGMGEILNFHKRYEQALPLVRRAQAVRSQSAEARRELAIALAGTGRFQEARPYAESAVQLTPDSADAHRVASSIYMGLLLTTEANDELRKAQSIERTKRPLDAATGVNESAPDFELPDPISGTNVRLSSFRGKSPVVLLFGSYSCPNFRASARALRQLAARYGSKVAFLMVYIREAHSNANWESARNSKEGINVREALNIEEKKDHALMCSRQLQLPFRAVVDGMDGAVENAYQAWPSRALVIGIDGRIRYSTRLTELDFHRDELESVLVELTRP